MTQAILLLYDGGLSALPRAGRACWKRKEGGRREGRREGGREERELV